MKKLFRSSQFLLLAGLAAFTGVLVHCGGSDDDAAPIAGPDGGGGGGTDTGGGSNSDSPSSSSGNDTGTGADTGNPGDGGGSGDGGGPDVIQIPDGGAPVDPGKIGCGTGAACISPAECCVQPDGGATCTTGGGTCSALGGARQQCDEAADCPHTDAGQQVCCFEKDGNSGLLATSCHANCNGGDNSRIQACRTTNECQSGTCAIHACSVADAGLPSIESCKPFPNLCP